MLRSTETKRRRVAALQSWAVALATLFAVNPVALADDRPAAKIVVHTIDSKHQAGPTQVRVLTPDRLEAERKYPVVYVLPVQAGTENRYGDGLEEVARKGLANRLSVIFVAPTFHHLPWYADHPTDPRIAQEAYFLEDVVPFVEKTYPASKERAGRLLLGFSKSGWGAFGLLLRHPDLFERAAAWDAPMVMATAKFGANIVLPSAESFDRYRIPLLLERQAKELVDGPPRLFLSGWCNFRSDHVAAHELMERLKIPHEYRDEKAAPHDWRSGWVEPSVEWLCRPIADVKSP